MRLHDRPLSPFGSRCRIQIYAKGLDVERVPVPFPNPESFLLLNPIGRVPALEVEGAVLPESQVICEYLEARFPEPPLLPRAPLDRARATLLARFADLYLLPLVASLAETRPSGPSELAARIEQLDALLAAGPYAAGDALSLADCALAPCFFFVARLAPAALRPGTRVACWWETVQQHPAVARVLGEMAHAFARLADTATQSETAGPQRSDEPGRFLTKYVCRKLVDRMREAQRRGPCGGSRCAATVMFVDVHGYSALAERTDPGRTMEILNRNLGTVIDTVFRHDGAVLQILGDGVMVVFGVHTRRDDDVLRAARAASEIHARLATLQAGRPADERIGVAIGIDAGEVVCGNVGHRERLEFAVVGDAVNVAARIQGLARSGETLVTPAVAEAVGREFAVESLEETLVKGRSRPVRICRLGRRKREG